MAPDFEIAKKMVQCVPGAGARLYIHENYRWQPQIRRIREIVDSGVIGKPFHGQGLISVRVSGVR